MVYVNRNALQAIYCTQNITSVRIVADRFHVIRIINHHFLACWRDIHGAGAKNRGLVSLMRRHRHNLRTDQQLRLSAYPAAHPVLETIYVSNRSSSTDRPTASVTSKITDSE